MRVLDRGGKKPPNYLQTHIRREAVRAPRPSLARAKAFQRLRIGDWVRVAVPIIRGPNEGYLTDKTVSGGRCCIESDAGSLIAMWFEIEPSERQGPAHPYFPIRKTLPYTRAATSDGGEVLFNRDYEPILCRSADGSARGCSVGERFPIGQHEKIYTDSVAPWHDEGALAACLVALGKRFFADATQF